MRNIDFGLAMVAARIASSEIAREKAIREKRKKRPPGGTLEVIRGESVRRSSAESPGVKPSSGWTLTREDGSVVRIDTGELVRPPDR